jgi:hypothetical protein
MEFCSCASEKSTKKLEIDRAINITPVNVLWKTHCANSEFKFWTPSDIACPRYKTASTVYCSWFHVFRTYRTTLVGSVGNYVTSPCGTRCAILAPPNNTTNATQKTALPTMTVCRRFHKLPPLNSPTHWLHLSRESPWRQFLNCKVGEFGQNEDATAVLRMLAQSDQE